MRDWGSALQYASPELQDDYGVVETAVSQGGCPEALAHASLRLRGRRQIVEIAVSRFGRGALQHAAGGLQDDAGLRRLACEVELGPGV